MDCFGLFHSGPQNPNYSGGCIRPDGYRIITVNGQRILEHRHVMEQHLGRPLLPSEIVHHINEVKDDNRIENLAIVTRSSHRVEHATPRSESHKQCTRCGELKPRTQFYRKRGNTRDPNRTQCKACEAELKPAYKPLTPQSIAAQWATRSPPHCATCGSTQKAHGARGECVNCYARTRRKG